MFNAELASSKSVNLTDTERLNIILRYMEYNARLQIVLSFAEPNNAVRHRASASALCAMWNLSKSDEHILRMECELQEAEDSPVWEMPLPN